jgi:hypothetical protein
LRRTLGQPVEHRAVREEAEFAVRIGRIARRQHPQAPEMSVPITQSATSISGSASASISPGPPGRPSIESTEGLAKVGIDQQHFAFLFGRDGEREIDRGKAFAFAGMRRADQNALRCRAHALLAQAGSH